ncbi:MAG: ABC transporter ATP-binding protein [Rhodospirillales bacterium]|nr:ABC transporter ATP-binding protein [Rhodospirillales bacterium]
MPDSIVLRLIGIEVRYGSTMAVKGLDLAVKDGEFVTLLGPSGCGKTTTLGVVAGFLEPSAGEVLLAEHSLVGLPPFRRDIGVVFQDYALFPHLSVAENVAFGLKMRKVPKPELDRRVDEMLSLVRLDEYAERSPQQLSGGQRQRVALARALVIRPRLLLLDEPLSNLDLKLREELRLEIVGLQRQLGIATIFVTHDQTEALVMSDRIAVMKDGRIEQLDAPHGIYEKPASKFVAEFIGTMNFFPAELTATAGADGFGTARTNSGRAVPVRIDGSMPVGGRISIAVRPEKAKLLRNGQDPGNAVAFPGRVANIAYLGSRQEIRLNLEGGISGMVELGCGDDERFNPGEKISLVVERRNCVALPESEVPE